MNSPTDVKPRERDAILQSLRHGVVPRIGLRHLQVGRHAEVAAVLEDLGRIERGGAAVRFIIGRFARGRASSSILREWSHSRKK